MPWEWNYKKSYNGFTKLDLDFYERKNIIRHVNKNPKIENHGNISQFFSRNSRYSKRIREVSDRARTAKSDGNNTFQCYHFFLP